MRYRSPWSLPGYAAGIALARRVVRLARGDENAFLRRLVERQNRRVRRHLLARRRAGEPPARAVLLILPRCVRQPCCPVDARGEIAACRECRRCLLGEVARLTERLGVRALVAFRSHVAFAIARRERPDLIVAVACEDRLVKALRNVPEVPALLAPLADPAPSCLGATFDLDWVAAQLTWACQGGEGPGVAAEAARAGAGAAAGAGGAS